MTISEYRSIYKEWTEPELPDTMYLSAQNAKYLYEYRKRLIVENPHYLWHTAREDYVRTGRQGDKEMMLSYVTMTNPPDAPRPARIEPIPLKPKVVKRPTGFLVAWFGFWISVIIVIPLMVIFGAS